METEGYEVVVARDGREAAERLEGRQPTLIVLDLMMPEMSGFQFAEQLAKRGLRPEVPLLVLTAASQAWLKAQWMEADAYLEKPFEIPELLNEAARLTRGLST